MHSPRALQGIDTAARPAPDASDHALSPFSALPSPAYAHSHSSPTDGDTSDVSPSASASADAFGCPQAPSLLPDFSTRAASPDGPLRTSHVPKVAVTHPYARLFAKRAAGGAKRRKIWNHALEKSVFTAHEIATMGAPHRRTIYMASLEAHVDRLHAQLLDIGLYPVPFEKLEPFKGLNSKTAKSMVAGLQHDASHIKMKLLELERANHNLRGALGRGAAMFPADGLRDAGMSKCPY
ncbi:hypothetical protein FA95DRAFT_1554320 [Auriscalpium vulgare]|uniref:Uncharacterized protein n=1 Tax=Auriscalpium vulgare TaxID=40419 RepID=A0ACB8S6S6_9AGAM|nr:hypothetical protein FA95DRAFT_1554320 [Auriscalpium vulgare]